MKKSDKFNQTCNQHYGTDDIFMLLDVMHLGCSFIFVVLTIAIFFFLSLFLSVEMGEMRHPPWDLHAVILLQIPVASQDCWHTW